MGTQWENFLQNLGEWEGSFTRLSPTGTVLEDTPTRLSLEGLDENQRVRFTLQFFAPGANRETDQPVRELVQDYQSLGRHILFFDSGAFSQASMQLSPVSTLLIEFGFIWGNRRLRAVHQFAVGGEAERFTLVREKRVGAGATENPPLTLEQLLGRWEGEAQTLFPDLRNPETFKTTLEVQRTGTEGVEQRITLASGNHRPHEIRSRGRVEGSMLEFEGGARPVRVLMLPDGASLTFPHRVEVGQMFFLEAGWLIEPNLRQRLMGSYNQRGEWTSVTLVTERKVG
ncbi:DUF3598 family protein [Laspinema olomoucense]|uniref:DUF3598 family protein n=1 Tax=Laspinema olomoucense D3b TaxID=2953688 RepID=A0ABT2NDT4_9CYAN|nr:DUF3598 family protein [Laspinema sp. D3b]MCT7980861.1 DUF3598 family protein [Laspinema sp. D3b]